MLRNLEKVSVALFHGYFEVCTVTILYVTRNTKVCPDIFCKGIYNMAGITNSRIIVLV